MQHVAYTLLLLLILSSYGPGQYPTVLRVPQSFTSIQSAVDAAQPGDTVLVDHGVYYENIVIRKEIVLASHFIIDGDTSHISQTIIDGSRPSDTTKASCVRLVTDASVSHLTLHGLSIRGGRGTLEYYPPEGRWFWLGGGVLVGDGSATITHCRIHDNTLGVPGDSTWAYGGGIAIGDYSPEPSPPVSFIRHNIIENNRAYGGYVEGAGIALFRSGIIENNVVRGNAGIPGTVFSFGGGICAASITRDTFYIRSNHVYENVATRGAGVGVFGKEGGTGPNLYLVNNIIRHNTSTERGGGVCIPSVWEAYVINNTVIYNQAVTFGGGIDLALTNGLMMNNIVAFNTPAEQVRSRPLIHATNNLIQGGFNGWKTIIDDPLFEDPSEGTRVRPGSPSIGTGANGGFMYGKHVEAPATDIYGRLRARGEKRYPDLGAVESDLEPVYKHSQDQPVKITVKLRALSKSEEYYEPRTSLLRSTDVKFFMNDTIPVSDLQQLDGLELAHHDVSLFVEFVPEGSRFSVLYDFLMEGRDFEWRRSSQYRLVKYSELESRPYIFRVQSKSRTHFGNPWLSSSMRIVVPPPWWDTWWFRSCVILLSLGIFTLIYLQEVKRSRRQRSIQQAFSRSQIESQEAERKRLAGELHDGLGQNLLLARNELQQYLQQNDGTREGVEQAARLLKESIDAAREMASNLHPHQLDRLGFCTALIAMADNFAHATGITVRHRCDHIDRDISEETALQLYRIIQEALSNVARHASAREVDIQIWKNPLSVEILITDDGKGFDTEETADAVGSRSGDGVSGGFGLSSMAERARIIAGELSVESSPGKGTSISITFPLERQRAWSTHRES